MDKEASDPVRVVIRERAREARLTMADLSRHVGRNETYMHQFMHRGSPRVLPEEVRGALADILQLPEDHLRPGGRRPPVPPIGFPRPLGPYPSGSTQDVRSTTLVPVFGDTDEVDPAAALQWTDRPPVLQSVADAFAIWISSAKGRMRPGDMVFVRTSQPPRIGDDVVALQGTTIVAIGDLVELDANKVSIQETPEACSVLDRSDHRLGKIVSISPA
jgi:hypothetical protein